MQQRKKNLAEIWRERIKVEEQGAMLYLKEIQIVIELKKKKRTLLREWRERVWKESREVNGNVKKKRWRCEVTKEWEQHLFMRDGE